MTYQVTYSDSEGNRSVRSFTTLNDACEAASDLCYGITGDEYAGFPLALDSYSLTYTDSEGMTRDATVSITEH